MKKSDNYKVLDKVLCVFVGIADARFITVGKTYNLKQIGDSYYFDGSYLVSTNNGDYHWFPSNNFKLISEIREEKLTKLGL